MGRIVSGIEKNRDVPSKLVPVFITCDPARDTPEMIRQYLQGTCYDFLQIFTTVSLASPVQQRMSLGFASNLGFISDAVLPVKSSRVMKAIISSIIQCSFI